MKNACLVILFKIEFKITFVFQRQKVIQTQKVIYLLVSNAKSDLFISFLFIINYVITFSITFIPTVNFH